MLNTFTTPSRGMAVFTNRGGLLWAALSCVLLLIGGLGPQAHAPALSFGVLPGATITTAYVVSGTIYVLLALAGGAGLARYATRPESAARSLRVSLFAGFTGIGCAIFTFTQIVGASPIEGVSAGWGLYFVLVASVSLLMSAGTLMRRHARRPGQMPA